MAGEVKGETIYMSKRRLPTSMQKQIKTGVASLFYFHRSKSKKDVVVILTKRKTTKTKY